MGEYHHNVDQKGRLIIPSKLRNDLTETVIVTRGLENCLFIYSQNEWQKIIKKLNTLPFTKKDARNFIRMFISGATECEFDKQGRIKLSNPLIDFAEITKECVVLGVSDRLEIWAKEKWNNFFSDNQDNFSDLADNLFDYGIDE